VLREHRTPCVHILRQGSKAKFENKVPDRLKGEGGPSHQGGVDILSADWGLKKFLQKFSLHVAV